MEVCKMSEVALQDNTAVPEPDRMNGNVNKCKLIQVQTTKVEENSHGGESNGLPLIASNPVKVEGTEKSEPAVVTTEVQYIESKDLTDVEDVDSCVKSLVVELGSKDWVSVCHALNNVRRLSLFHEESIISILSDIIPLVVKSVKNPRSALCKTAIMASEDIFSAYKDGIIDSLDLLLVQLLLKSSQDKKFVCEAAEKALITLTSSVSPLLLLPRLQPYIKDRNPRIRAKASLCISRSVRRLGDDGIKAFGMEKLIQLGASQLSDQLPESRDVARALLLELQAAYERSHSAEIASVPDDSTTEIASLPEENNTALSWKHFCESKLSPLNAQAVLRVTGISKEVSVVGSS